MRDTKAMRDTREMPDTTAQRKTGKAPPRPLVLGACFILMLCLGTVYAWSYFQPLLVKDFGWSNRQVSLTFSLAIFFLGAAASAGGLILPKVGPRPLAIAGSALFGAGHLIAAWALRASSLTLLYAGYGVVAGMGLGFCYVTPVAVASKWFPERRGLASGFVVMGFGLGALMMSKLLAPLLLGAVGHDMSRLFLVLGFLFLAATLLASAFVANPPRAADAAAYCEDPDTPRHADYCGHRTVDLILSPRFALFWLVFFCNISAGIAIIGFQSPLIQDLIRQSRPATDAGRLASLGATLIAVTSLFNGLGRFAWAAVSDRVGRVKTFRILVASELAVFAALIVVRDPWVVAGLLCWVLFCYGGGFGTMPAAILEAFGPVKMAAMYGAVLTAWSAAGLAGPQITAFIKDTFPRDAVTLSFAAGAAFAALGLVAAFLLPRDRESSAGG